MKPISQSPSPLAGQIPQGPVVIHSSEVARTRLHASQVRRSAGSEQFLTSQNLLVEITEEVARRLALSN